MPKLPLAATLVALAVMLTGCSAGPAEPASPAAAATPTPTPTPTPSVPPAVPGLRDIHSPGVVDVDETLTPGECHAVTQSAVSGFVLPDPACTPGAIDPAVTQADLASTVCESGYTRTVRPPASNTNAFKSQALAAYGEAYARTIELDHLVPLELGGANSASNLWPEPNKTSATGFNNPKDPVEAKLKAAVCSGTVTLAAAQDAIATDWVTAEAVLGL
jgi:hypothetical protein